MRGCWPPHRGSRGWPEAPSDTPPPLATPPAPIFTIYRLHGDDISTKLYMRGLQYYFTLQSDIIINLLFLMVATGSILI